MAKAGRRARKAFKDQEFLKPANDIKDAQSTDDSAELKMLTLNDVPDCVEDQARLNDEVRYK